MYFDKPVVFKKDIPEIISSFNVGNVLEAKYLGGVPNVTYRVITPTNSLAIRICNHGYTSKLHLKTEVALLEYLDEKGFSLAPIPVRAADGEYLQEWRGYNVFAMKLIDGIPGDRVKLNGKLCFDVGQALASLKQKMLFYEGYIPDGETYDERGFRLLRLLPETARFMGWTIDVESIVKQWHISSNIIEGHRKDLDYGIIHTDVWPPNIICKGDQVVGIVDFDDWACGPAVIDLAASLVEFPWFNSLDFNESFATELFRGYFLNGGKLSLLEQDLLIVGMELACASWLSCNALHRIQFEESEIYLKKLQLLGDKRKREALDERLRTCINQAQVGS